MKGNKYPVIIAVQNKHHQAEISNCCAEYGVVFCTYDKVFPILVQTRETEILKNISGFKDKKPNEALKMTKYIGIDIPVTRCNLRCSYCYLGQMDYLEQAAGENIVYEPQFLRHVLRKEKVGGSALVGLCGDGETLLSRNFEKTCAEILKEGHYIHIVTNGLLADKIKAIIFECGEYARNIIFKISFHYSELKKLNLLDQFANNVKMISDSEASYTIELMPHDEIIDDIPDIIDYSIKNFGALPQLTIGRQHFNGGKLLTNMSEEEYKKVWGVFDSEMFDMRMELYQRHGQNCLAGARSCFIDLSTGNVKRCVYEEQMGNICIDDQNLNLDPVGDACPLNYCFNCHVYGSMGVVGNMDTSCTYMTIRDRKRADGSHWLKDNMREYLDIKLSDVD